MGEVMDAQEREAEQFLTTDQMMQVGTGVMAAGHTRAACVQRSVVVPETSVAQVPAFASNQGCAMPAKTGGQDAIKHVNPVGHGNCHLAQGANAHEVAGTISG